MTRSRRLASSLLVALVALAAAVPASAAVSTGHSGWSWANPGPQGEDLTDVTFAGADGYAVGGFGTLLRSTDAGATWTGVPSGTVQDLTRVAPAGAGGTVASGSCAVRRTAEGRPAPSTIDVGGGDTGCGSAVQAVSFADATSGYILFANGVVLATSDGGASLSRRTPVPGGAPADIVATSPTVVFAVSGGGLYRSLDGAASWTLVFTSQGVALNSVTFPAPGVGYVVGGRQTVGKTEDGGATWTQISYTSVFGTPDFARVRCGDARTCLFTTVAGAPLFRTADGGTTYTQVTASAEPIRGVAFASPTRVVGVGDGGATVISDDAGVTWRGINTEIPDAPWSVTAGRAGFAYASNPAALALTTDGGATWRSAGIPTPLPIATAAFSDPLNGFAQDTSGTLRRTTDGGITWQVLDPGAVTGPLSGIAALGAGNVVLVSPTGVLRSTDNGGTFRAVRSPAFRARALRAPVLAVQGTGRRVFIVTRTGILRSSNAGATWTRMPLPRVGGRVAALTAGDCTGPSTCWIATTGSRAYRTVNGGARWVAVHAALGVPASRIASIAAAGPTRAFVTLRDAGAGGTDARGVVLATGDGGVTWAPQVVSRAPLTRVDAVAGRAWAVTAEGQVFTTSTQGQAAQPTTLTLTAAPRTVRRGARVTITGRLRGATGGEQVTVAATGAAPATVTVAARGTFTTSLRVRRATTVVAQWTGDGVRAGAGSRALVVRLRR